MSPSKRLVRRRALLLGSLAAGGMAATGCSTSEGPGLGFATDVSPSAQSKQATMDSSTRSGAGRVHRVLLAYFSRPGENYYRGGRIDLEIGNTQVLAEAIADRIRCDIYRIEATTPYSDDYDATVRRNVDEQDANARPGIAGELPDLDGYDVVLLASPVWNVRSPMIMKTFTESLDFTDRTVHPLVTYAVSGLGTAVRDYTESCPGATIAQPLAVQGEEVAGSGRDIDTWVRSTGLAP